MGGNVGELVELLAGGAVLVLTGAGVSTDSGIPAYRDRTGRLRHTSPMTIDRFLGSETGRQRYWARSHVGWPRVAAAQPNATHRLVAAWQRSGTAVGVVTQNVDGLHTAAGTPDVIDLHGRLDRVVCLRCGARRPRLEVALRLDAVNPGFRAVATAGGAVRPDGDVVLPDDELRRFRAVDCRACGGILKPDVVFFGEHVPAVRFWRALALLDRASALVVLGSSLAVGSGYRFVTAARRRALPVAIVTQGATRADRFADVRIDEPLAAIVAAVAGTTAGPATTR